MFLVVAGGVLGRAGAADLIWQTDLPQALIQAKAEKKLVLMDFTGSDWCPPCQMLAKKVLDQPEFAAYAKTNLVLVQVDFPRLKPQADAVKAASAALAGAFKVEGFPTLIALNPNSTTVWRTDGVTMGFLEGGPQGLITQLEAAGKVPAASAGEAGK